MRAVLAAFLILPLAACQPGAVEGGKDAAAAGGVRVTGELRSSQSYYFGPPSIPDMWNYTIAYMAPDGEEVKEGTVILRFDGQELMTRMRDKSNALNEKQKELEKARIVARETLAEARLAVEESKAALDKAHLKADIPAELLANRDYRENQILLQLAELDYELRQQEVLKEEDIQRTEVEILEREVDVLQAEVASLQGSIDSMAVKAPGDGVVIHATDRRQGKLAVGDNVWMGRRVMEFPDLTKLQAHLEIPERESARIKIGQTVRFALDAVPDRQFHGEIVELASVIHTRSINQPEKVFDATVVLDHADTELMRPGMSVKAEILVNGGEDAGP
jgi:multidrug efflux pump subunit AcrA (membrane-fusion protein)